MEERNDGEKRELWGGNVVGDVLFFLLFIAVLILSYLVTVPFARLLPRY